MTPAIDATPTLFRSAPSRGASVRVEREARVIRGYSVLTSGVEAQGHGLFIDETMAQQAADAINAAGPAGIKSRFTHPGPSSDGLGKFLGRTRNARLEGGRVLADLHLSELADASPSGKLGSYVMDMAEKDPAAFGASIVFRRDRGAEELFVAQNKNPQGEFRSPDARNERHVPHARLKSLSASDVVDDPAANPGGMFSADELAIDLDALGAFAFGLSDERPELVVLDIDTDRMRGFAARFLESRGLVLRQKEKSDMSDKPNDPKPALTSQVVLSEHPGVAEELILIGRKKELERFEALSKRFKDRPEFVVSQYSEGRTVDQAENAFRDLEISRLSKENEELRRAAQRGAQPLRFGEAPDGGEAKTFMGEVRRVMVEQKCNEVTAMGIVAQAEPELYEEHKGSIPAVRRKR